MSDPDRRHILRLAAATAAGTALSAAGAQAAEKAVDTGAVQGGKVEFPAWTAPTERPAAPPPPPPPAQVADQVAGGRACRAAGPIVSSQVGA